MAIPPDERRNVGALSERQRRYLEYHRELVFLEARVKAWLAYHPPSRSMRQGT
jgi:hypothetical protein